MGHVEAPVDFSRLRIASVCPFAGHIGQLLQTANPLLEALPTQDRDFNLGHVEPGTMLGRVVEFEPTQDSPGLCGRKRVVGQKVAKLSPGARTIRDAQGTISSDCRPIENTWQQGLMWK